MTTRIRTKIIQSATAKKEVGGCGGRGVITFYGKALKSPPDRVWANEGKGERVPRLDGLVLSPLHTYTKPLRYPYAILFLKSTEVGGKGPVNKR